MKEGIMLRLEVGGDGGRGRGRVISKEQAEAQRI